MRISRRSVDILYYLTVLTALAILSISLAELKVIGWTQAVSSLWIVAVLAVSFLLHHLLWRSTETERLGAVYALKKQELETAEKLRAQTRADLHAHHTHVLSRMKMWRYWPRESGEMIYTVPEGARPLLTTEPPNLEKDKTHLKEFPLVWNVYWEAPEACKELREAEEAASVLIVSRLQALNSNNLLIAKQEADGSFKRLTKELVQEIDAEIRSNKRQVTLLKLEQKGVGKPSMNDQPSSSIKEGRDSDQLPQLLSAIKQSEEVRGLIENRLNAWDKVEANKNAFLRALTTDVIDPAENGNWKGFERGECDDCKALKERLRLPNSLEVPSKQQ